MNEGQKQAAIMLLRVSALAGHPHVQQHTDVDSGWFDWGQLDSWRWSSGETILIELLRTIVLGHGLVTVGDLHKLDEVNRQAAAEAIHLLFNSELAHSGWL